VQIPVLVFISVLWNDYTLNSLQIFTNFCTLFGCGQLEKCDRFYVWCFGNHKPEVDIRFWRCADWDFRCFGLWSPHVQQIGNKFPAVLKLEHWIDPVTDFSTAEKDSGVKVPMFVELLLLFNNFFPIVDTCLSYEDIARQSEKNLLSSNISSTCPLSGYIFATKACIDSRRKLIKQQYLPHMSLQYGELLPING